MLRRVRLAHRQHLTPPTDFRTRPTTLLRCNAMSAAVRTRCLDSPSYRSRDGVARAPLTGQPSAFAMTNPHPSLPTEVLAMLDDLLAHSTDEPFVLRNIQRSPPLIVHFKDSQNVQVLAEAIANSKSPMTSLRVLIFAHKLGCNLKQSVYQGVAFHLANRRLWDGVLQVVALGKEHTGRTTSRLLSWRARALIETRNFAALETVLQQYKEQKLVPSRRVFHLLLSGNIQNRDITGAKLCLRAMSEAGVPPDASTHAIVATHYRALGLDPNVENRALEALQSLQARTATNVVNSLIRLRLDSQDMDGALQLLSLFRQRDIGPIPTTIATSGGGSRYAGGDHLPIVNLPLTTRRDLIPNAATFVNFINYLTTQSDTTAALQLFRMMVTTGISPNGFAVASLVHLLFSIGQGDVAVRMVAEMCSVKAPFHMYNMLSSQDTQDLPWVPAGMAPTIQIFNALLRGLLRTRGLKVAGPFFRILHANNLQLNALTLEIFMDHLSKTESAKPRVLIRMLDKFTSEDLRPTLRHMHVIFTCILRLEKFLSYGRGWDTIAAKFSPSRREAIRPCPEHRLVNVGRRLDPTAGMQLSQALVHRRLARSVFSSFADRKLLADPAMFALRIRHDAVLMSDPDAAKEVFNALLFRGIRPTRYHIGGLMEGLAQAGDLEGAMSVMKSAGKVGIRPNVVMFTILISACARRGNPERAFQFFQQMISADIEPDVASIDALSGAFFAVGKYCMARKILVSLWPYIQPFPDTLNHASLKTMIRHFRQLARNYRLIQKPLEEHRRIMRVELGKLGEDWKPASESRP